MIETHITPLPLRENETEAVIGRLLVLVQTLRMTYDGMNTLLVDIIHGTEMVLRMNDLVAVNTLPMMIDILQIVQETTTAAVSC